MEYRPLNAGALIRGTPAAACKSGVTRITGRCGFQLHFSEHSRAATLESKARFSVPPETRPLRVAEGLSKLTGAPPRDAQSTRGGRGSGMAPRGERARVADGSRVERGEFWHASLASYERRGAIYGITPMINGTTGSGHPSTLPSIPPPTPVPVARARGSPLFAPRPALARGRLHPRPPSTRYQPPAHLGAQRLLRAPDGSLRARAEPADGSAGA